VFERSSLKLNEELCDEKEEKETNVESSKLIKNGALFIKHCESKDWKLCDVKLREDKMFIYSEQSPNVNMKPNEDEFADEASSDSNVDLNSPQYYQHFFEPWFHGKLKGKNNKNDHKLFNCGRMESKQLLRKHSHFGNGTFLVRESESRTTTYYEPQYVLGFLLKGKALHCLIRLHSESKRKKYSIQNNKLFSSIYELIDHYKHHPFRVKGCLVTLKRFVPNLDNHLYQDWFHGQATREISNKYLINQGKAGSFLVRASESIANCFVVSFRTKNKVFHCRVEREKDVFTIGNKRYKTLLELIEWYKENAIFRSCKLKYPVTIDMLSSHNSNVQAFEMETVYCDLNNFNRTFIVRALFDYKANREDELTFCKNAIITN
ncbi:phospholipase C gamma-like isoform X3, partial [Dinothrombium tinctorium]